MYTPRKCWECGAASTGAEPEPLDRATHSGKQTEAESDLGIRHRILLESNESPMDSEIPFIQSVVAKTTARLARLETIIAQIRHQLEILEGEREETSMDLARNTAILSSLRRMPPEVLCEIFSWTLPSLSSALRRERLDANESPWVLAQTCHRWRTVAVGTPSLWSVIAITYFQCDEPSAIYPLPAARIQLQRAQNLKIHFYGSEREDPRPQIEMFCLLSEHCARWEELSLVITSGLLPLLPALRHRLPLLRRIWLEWVTNESQAQSTVFEWFETAPSLVNVAMFNEFRFVPTSLPVHQLTRYHLDAPWRTHREILKAAQNLVKARIDVDFDEQPWPESEGTITLSYLRRLSVSDWNVLKYLKAPSLEEIAFNCDKDDPQDALHCLEPFVARSSCTLRTLSIKGVPNATATEILQKYPSIVKFTLIVFDDDYNRDSYKTINHLVSQSRWNAEECALKAAAFLTHSIAPAATRTAFNGLRKKGLEVLWLEGPDASDVMDCWGFNEDWN